MAERLTEKIRNDLYVGKQCDDCLESIEYCGECSYVQSIKNKLGKFEDILEKYGIGIQKLDYILEDYSKNQGRCFVVCEERDTLRQERAVLKRAFVSACAFLAGITQDNVCDYEDYFYQQAKKEKEEQNNDTNQ